MNNAVQIARIIEGALVGDVSKVRAYGELIAAHFEQAGDARSARIVRRPLGLEPPGPKATLDGTDNCPNCGPSCNCDYMKPFD